MLEGAKVVVVDVKEIKGEEMVDVLEGDKEKEKLKYCGFKSLCTLCVIILPYFERCLPERTLFIDTSIKKNFHTNSRSWHFSSEPQYSSHSWRRDPSM